MYRGYEGDDEDGTQHQKRNISNHHINLTLGHSPPSANLGTTDRGFRDSDHGIGFCGELRSVVVRIFSGMATNSTISSVSPETPDLAFDWTAIAAI